MVKVTLLYFGAIRDITGASNETTDVPGTLEGLRELLLARFPPLSALRFRYSVNEKLIDGDRELSHGDTVALLPPFAGG